MSDEPKHPLRGCLIAAAVLAAITAFVIWILTQLPLLNLNFGSTGNGSLAVGYTLYDTAAVPNHRLRCVAHTHEHPTAAVTVAHGMMYVRDNFGLVTAFDVKTCVPRWSQLAGGGPIAGVTFAPAVDAHNVYVGGGDGIVRAFDARTGRMKWASGRLDVFGAPVTVDHGSVYANAEGVHAFDATTGAIRWEAAIATDTNVTSYTMPVVRAGAVYVASAEGAVHAYDARTGRVRWTAPTNSHRDPSTFGPGCTIAATDTTIYASCSDGALYALSAATGAHEWSLPVGTVDPFGSLPAVAANRVFVNGTALSAIDATSGKLLWLADEAASSGTSFVAPVVANGIVYATGKDALLHAVDAASGRQRAAFGREPAGAGFDDALPPTVAGDELYLPSGDDAVYVYDLAS